jgi:hypothetical protein
METSEIFERVPEPVRYIGHVVAGRAEVVMQQAERVIDPPITALEWLAERMLPEPVVSAAKSATELGRLAVRLPGGFVESVRIGTRVSNGEEIRLVPPLPETARVTKHQNK